MNPSSTAPIEVGEEAPDFKLFADTEEPWRLSDHADQPMLLLFFPGAFTSVCTDELNEVNNDLDSYQGVHVTGISTDAPFVLSEFRSVHGFDFPLLSDHDADVCSRYGSKYDGNFGPMNLDRVAKRSAFVVDEDRIIRYVEILENASQQPDFQAIKRTLARLRS